MKTTRTIRGIRDVIFPESGKWKKIINITEDIFEGYGYKKIFLPALEYSELFCRSIGEDTDIVEKLPDPVWEKIQSLEHRVAELEKGLKTTSNTKK